MFVTFKSILGYDFSGLYLPLGSYVINELLCFMHFIYQKVAINTTLAEL